MAMPHSSHTPYKPYKPKRIRRRLARLGIPLFQSTPAVDSDAEYRRCLELLDRFIADKQLDVLRAILAGDVTWGELLYADARQELTGTKIMATVKLGRALWGTTERKRALSGAIGDTLPAMGTSDATRKRYATSLEAFRHQQLVPWPASPMRVRDLERVRWNELAERWPKSAADWNHVVRAVRAFLTKYLGSERHEFREKIGKLTPMLPEDERVPDLTPEIFGHLLAALPESAKVIAMGLLLTGMRDRSEFFAATADDLLPATCQVRIPGRRTKTRRGRYIAIDESMWPWIVASIPAPIGYQQFLRHFHRAAVAVGAGRYGETGNTKRVRAKLARGRVYSRRTGSDSRVEEATPAFVEIPRTRYQGLRPHDLRHALAQWTHDAGRSLGEIQSVLGHANISMTARYARQKASRAVAGTAATIVGKVVQR
jgi:integrase